MAADEQMLDLKHELDRYSARVKENQTKIKHFNNEVHVYMYLIVYTCM